MFGSSFSLACSILYLYLLLLLLLFQWSVFQLMRVLLDDYYVKTVHYCFIGWWLSVDVSTNIKYYISSLVYCDSVYPCVVVVSRTRWSHRLSIVCCLRIVYCCFWPRQKTARNCMQFSVKTKKNKIKTKTKKKKIEVKIACAHDSWQYKLGAPVVNNRRSQFRRLTLTECAPVVLGIREQQQQHGNEYNANCQCTHCMCAGVHVEQ